MLYKHKNNTDVAIQVIKNHYIKERESWKLTVRWWNIVKSHPPYDMGFQETVEIPAKVWDEDWETYYPIGD